MAPYAEVGEMVMLIDRWERAEHMTAVSGSWSKNRMHLLFILSFLLLEKLFFVEPLILFGDY